MGAPTLGFSIFNYVAMAAQALLEEGLKVLIIDFDAHHGNGTQDIFWEEPRVVHIDIHEEDIYPGTRRVTDIGGENARGSKINIPLPPYSGNPEYIWVIENITKPIIEAFKPEAIVVSAGFDAYQGDLLTRLKATEETYEAIAEMLRSIWIEKKIRALVINLEGCYGEGLERGLTAYIETLLGLRKRERRARAAPPLERVTITLTHIMEKYLEGAHNDRR